MNDSNDQKEYLNTLEQEFNERIYAGDKVTLQEVYEKLGAPKPTDPKQLEQLKLAFWDKSRFHYM